MKLSGYTILFFMTCCVVTTSCKTTETAKTISTQNEQPTGYILAIRVRDSDAGITKIMNRIFQSCSITGVQIEMGNKFIDPDCEIHVSIMTVPDNRIIMIKDALYAIPEVKMIKSSKN